MFYHFLNQLFEITMELDGSINKLSGYTIGVQYHAWLKYVSPYRQKGGDKSIQLKTK